MQDEPIRILATGGTIDKIYFDANSEFQVGEPKVKDILEEANINLEIEIESLFKKDSLELGDADRKIICEAAQRASENRIVITHGTDTMSVTARALMNIRNKTIVLTGSLEPAGLRNSDAYFNIGAAITAVQLLPPGVYITMQGKIFPAGQVEKNPSTRRFVRTT